MTEGEYHPYPQVRESNVPWLGKIPEHWQVERAQYLFKEQNREVREIDEIVTAFRDGQVCLRRNRRSTGYTMAALEHGYQGVRQGDLVLHAMDAFAGAIGVSEDDGKATPEYVVVTPYEKETQCHYFANVLRVMADGGYILVLCPSVRERAPRFRFVRFQRTLLPVPPHAEQVQIAKFLDYETAKIDALIEKQQQLIALLQEKRQAVISHAVTKGLNPDVPMRDSGIEWLGDVPAHWVTVKLGYRYEVLLGKMLDASKVRGNHLGRYLRNTDVQWDRINEEDLPMMDFLPHERERYSVRAGDLLVCEGGQIGRCAIWAKDYPCFYQKALHRLRPWQPAEDMSRFMYYHLLSAVAQKRFEAGAGKATIAHLPAETFRQCRFTFPSYEEQQSIVAALDAEVGKLDNLERKALDQVELLQERRASLISAAVTGKIDVRGWTPPKSETGEEGA